MKKVLVFAALAALFILSISSTAVAADVSGTWKLAAMQGRGGGGGGGMTMERSLVLKQDGSKLTGKFVMKMGDNPPREMEIQNGKVDGDNIEFTVKMQGRDGNEMVQSWKAKVTGDKMEGTSEMQGMGQPRPFTATKQ